MAVLSQLSCTAHIYALNLEFRNSEQCARCDVVQLMFMEDMMSEQRNQQNQQGQGGRHRGGGQRKPDQQQEH